VLASTNDCASAGSRSRTNVVEPLVGLPVDVSAGGFVTANTLADWISVIVKSNGIVSTGELASTDVLPC